MTTKKNGERRHLSPFVVVIYSVSKDPPSPIALLKPIPVATSPTATFDNRTTNDESIVVRRRS
jgi:hypothetical protein